MNLDQIKRKEMPNAKKVEYTLHEVAETCLSTKNGNVTDAAEELERMVRKSPSLRTELTDPLLKAACYDVVSAMVRAERDRVIRSVNKPPEKHQPADTSGRIIALASTLLDFPLPGGKRLKDAVTEDLIAASDFYDKQSATMAKRGRWLRSVAEKLPKKKRVSQVFDADKLRAMLESA